MKGGNIPRKGKYNKKDPVMAKFRGRNRSAEVPAHTGRDAPPKKPAKNLKMHSAVILGAKPAPSVNSALIGTEMR